ncbi:MAG TPA: L-histidine N(alpha)-methyltransferase [Steroidobacteraceae bacterium]
MRSTTIPAWVNVAPGDSAFLNDVLRGFSAPSRAIEPRWFYDRRGSQLFEAITELPEYYVTRVERAILSAHSADIANAVGQGRALIELGSGASTKTPLLIAAIAPSLYVPIDISGEFLKESADTLGRAFPMLPILPITADFMNSVTLPIRVKSKSLIGYFAGSTIGNMAVPVAVDFLRTISGTLGEGALFLIGIDRIKDEDRLLAAYDDRQGITAQFNLNLLHRINRELDGSIPVDAFRHLSRWNESEARIEMHLQATRSAHFTIAGRSFSIAAGETIHTENSCKYGPRDARLLLKAGGWSPIAEWTDPEGLFALILAEN